MSITDLHIVLDWLAGLDWLLGLSLMGMGLVCMLIGFRLFSLIAPLSLGIAGFILGAIIPDTILMQLICAVGLGLLLAGLSVFMYKIAVACLAGGWSGLAMILLLNTFRIDERATMFMGCFVFLVIAALAIVMYHELVIYVTSLEGTLLFLSGLVIFVSQNNAVWRQFRDILLEVPVLALFMVICGTVTAFYAQVAELSKKQSGASG